jgi:16S rRNA pseudouridine516 synthase
MKDGGLKIVRLLANLGYGSRKEVTRMLRDGRVTRVDGSMLGPDAYVPPADHDSIRVDDEALDPAPGMVLMLHKPINYICSTRENGRLVHDLLPPRYRLRSPQLSSVGRLDSATSGLLLLTDDGVLLHQIIAPKSHMPKVYEVTLAEALRGHEAEMFASGTLLLDSETTPLVPALLDPVEARRVRITLFEGRYHQVRRMFAAVGNHVETLQRVAIGGLTLGDLQCGEWRRLGEDEIAQLLPGKSGAA